MQHLPIRRLEGRKPTHVMIFQSGFAGALLLAGLTHTQPALADDDDGFRPGNLLVSRAIYDNNPNNIVAGVTQLPPGCTGSNCATSPAASTGMAP
jgi:hypothetical protein